MSFSYCLCDQDSVPARPNWILQHTVQQLGVSKLAILITFHSLACSCTRYSQSRRNWQLIGGFVKRFFGLLIVLGLVTSSALAKPDKDSPARTPEFKHVDHTLNIAPPQQASLEGQPVVDLTHSLWARVAAKHSLDPYVLYAVALVESARIANGLATPWPWALNHTGKTFYPETSSKALAQIRERLANGDRVIDVGLMQVNLRWHGKRAKSLEALIDPVTNVELGAQIMAEAMATAPGDVTLGIGRYHAWQNRPEAYRYGRRVLALAERLRSSSSIR